MNTTPKPSATKNSNGELVGPPPLLFCCVEVGEAVAEVVVADEEVCVSEDIVAAGVECPPFKSWKVADPHRTEGPAKKYYRCSIAEI